MLAGFSEADLQVQIVWEPVLRSDIAPPLTGVLALPADRRVSQYWDPGRVLSADLVRSVNEAPRRYGFEEALPEGFLAWDVIAVFGRSARWDDAVPVPAYYGGPVVDAIDAASAAIRDQLAAAR